MDLHVYNFDSGMKEAEDYHELKFQLHRYLIAEIEREHVALNDLPRAQVSEYVHNKVVQYIGDKHLAVNSFDIENLGDDMLHELMGFGPLESLIRDDHINDILVNGARQIFVERSGRLEHTPLRFIDDEHVLRVIRRILAPLGRRIDESSPMVDARLPDGSRVNAIIPPLALNGPCLSIRKFRKDPLLAADLLHFGTIDHGMLHFLTAAVEKKCSVVISGGTGAGKTTLLNVLSRSIHLGERIVTIEDAAELHLDHVHVVRLETRPANIDGIGEVTARDLVCNALRMRPDRIILGEVRGVEIMDVLQAMNTGHEGCMTTVHANNASDAVLRMEMLAGLAGFKGTENTLRHMIAAAVSLIIQINRLPNGQRKITSITEVVGIRDQQIVLNELFIYDSNTGRFVETGVSPCHPRLRNVMTEGRW